MKIKRALLNFLHRNKLLVSRIRDVQPVIDFINRFNEHYRPTDLIRVGGRGDGAYLVPKLISDAKFCFSPGVSDIANFEQELCDSYNIPCFLSDASVEGPPIINPLIKFQKRYLGSQTQKDFITLSDWLDSALESIDPAAEGILQMDIEGFEYDVLIAEPMEVLERFSIIIIEFHSFQNIFERQFNRMVTAIFEKLYSSYDIVHVHPNNCCGIASVDGVDVPRVFEVTFLKRNLRKNNYPATSNHMLPHPLDVDNIPSKPPIYMPESWWK